MAVRHGLGALACLVVVVAVAGCRALLPQQDEYEEEIYLALDGSATMYVNGSVPALVALRGLPLDPNPLVPVDRQRVRELYESPVTHVTRVSTSRRAGRRFVHLRIDVGDVRRLAEVRPFAWSTYRWVAAADEYVYQQVVGAATGGPVTAAGWRGTEMVAFRMHLPSRIRYHDAPSKTVERRATSSCGSNRWPIAWLANALSIIGAPRDRIDSLPDALAIRRDDCGRCHPVCRPALLDHAQRPEASPGGGRLTPDTRSVSHEPECRSPRSRACCAALAAASSWTGTRRACRSSAAAVHTSICRRCSRARPRRPSGLRRWSCSARDFGRTSIARFGEVIPLDETLDASSRTCRATSPARSPGAARRRAPHRRARDRSDVAALRRRRPPGG